MVSPEVSDVIDSQSSKLGMWTLFINDQVFFMLQNASPFCHLLNSSVSGSFSHGFTYSGHPVACAVAIETLKIYKCVHF